MSAESTLSSNQRDILERLEDGLPIIGNNQTKDDIRWLLANGYVESLYSPFKAVGFLTVTDKGRRTLKGLGNG
jgi:hypothetical protein